MNSVRSTFILTGVGDCARKCGLAFTVHVFYFYCWHNILGGMIRVQNLGFLHLCRIGRPSKLVILDFDICINDIYAFLLNFHWGQSNLREWPLAAGHTIAKFPSFPIIGIGERFRLAPLAAITAMKICFIDSPPLHERREF